MQVLNLVPQLYFEMLIFRILYYEVKARYKTLQPARSTNRRMAAGDGLIRLHNQQNRPDSNDSMSDDDEIAEPFENEAKTIQPIQSLYTAAQA